MPDVNQLCGVCGHPRYVHRPVPLREHYSRDGHLAIEMVNGPCERGRLHRDLHVTDCPCVRYVPDPYPRLTELLGFDHRGPRWHRPTAPPGFQLPRRGDLIDVTYGAYRTRQRVADVSATFDQVTILLDRPEETV